MDNIEVKEDFIKMMKEIHPNTVITERDDLIIGMAINHAFLCMGEDKDEK